MGKNVIIFGADMSSSVHITDNKKKDILILDFGPTQGLDDTTFLITQYSINFSRSYRKFYLSLHYNGSIYLLMLQKYINSKQTFL